MSKKEKTYEELKTNWDKENFIKIKSCAENGNAKAQRRLDELNQDTW